MDLEDDEREEMLRMTPQQMSQVASVVNRYPNVDVQYEIEDSDDITTNSRVIVRITLEREDEEEEEEEPVRRDVGPVTAPFYPKVCKWDTSYESSS